jgi:ribonuclease HII
MNLADLEIEASCFCEGAHLIAGVDEVGRGPIAGPVVVGAVLLNSAQCDERAIPHGLADSKLLSEKKRMALVPEIKKWAFSYGIGQCSPEVVDEKGIMYALSKAGNNALESAMSKTMCGAELGVRNTDSTKQGFENASSIDTVLLDGTFDYLSADMQPGHSDCAGGFAVAGGHTGGHTGERAHSCASDHASDHAPGCPGAYPIIKTIKKGDIKCASIAAASVLAKVYRDDLMIKLSSAFPEYEWAKNKGYGTKAHFEAVKQFGPTRHHRKSWLK